jgi:hypothetical protein
MVRFESDKGSTSRPIRSRSFISFGTSERIVSSVNGFGTNVPVIEGTCEPMAEDGTVPDIVDTSKDPRLGDVVGVDICP